jgi:import inner membrane translocase subunit TIM44
MKSRPSQLRSLRLRSPTLSPLVRATLIRPTSQPFSTSSAVRNAESKKDDKSEKKEEEKKRAPPPEDNAPPQSPFKVFANVLKEEIAKNKAWQDNVKQLGGEVDKLADSAAMKRARDVYERARVSVTAGLVCRGCRLHRGTNLVWSCTVLIFVQITSSIKSNPRLQAAVAELQKAGVSVSDAVNRSLQDSEVLRAISVASGRVYSAAASATQPVRDTAAYKALAESVEEAFDDSGAGSRYGGYEEREERRRRREKRALKAGKKGVATKRVKENPE